MRLEQLEAREVPAIVQTGLPTFLAAGPNPAVNSPDETGIVGPVDPFTQVPDGDPPALFSNPAVGAADDLAVVPGDPDTQLLASASGGIWRTRNARAASPTWVPLTDGAATLSFAALDLNPDNPNQIVAGVSENPTVINEGGDLLGVVISDNALSAAPTFRVGGPELRGLSTQSVLTRSGFISRIDGSARANYILAGTNGGLYRSLDNGASFQNLNGVGGLPFDFAIVYSMAADPTQPGRVYALASGGLFRTEDIGAPEPVWVNISQPFMNFRPNGAVDETVNGKISIHTTPGFNVVYVAVTNQFARFDNLVSSRLASVSFSTDAGTTFTPMDLPENVEPQTFIVANATNASPIVITTTAAHGLSTNDRVRISGVQGNLGANAIFTITRIDDFSFSLQGGVGTGTYGGGGVVEEIQGINRIGLGITSLGLVADPVNPFLVYIGGDGQDSAGADGASIQRGNRAAPRAGGNLVPSPQWTRVVGAANAASTAPFTKVRDLEVDAAGRLIASTGGGVYSRANARDNSSPWVSELGNLSIAQFVSIGYDPINNVLFGGTRDTGLARQLGGAGVVGSNFWTLSDDFDDGSYIAEADSTTIPGSTIRYTSIFKLLGVQRQVFDGANNLVSTDFVRLASTVLDAMGNPVLGLRPADAGGDNDPRGRAFFKLNAVDPRLVLLGRYGLYEDDNPDGNAGDSIADITPPDLVGRVSAIEYGGRLAGVNVPRAAYVGTESGQLYARGQRDGFQLRPLPGTGAVTAIAVDPDDFRIVYAVRGESAVYSSTDGGFTWTDITQNLFAQTVGADGRPVLFEIDPATGSPRGGLTTAIRDITVYDPTPGGAAGGGTTLIAAGRFGVFRFNPAQLGPVGNQTAPGLNPIPGFGWTQYGVGLPNASVSKVRLSGNRLYVGTIGRGAYVIPDISTTINVAATVSVVGGDGDDTLTLTADPTNPNNVIVSDGMGNFFAVGRATSATVRFLGGAGADLIQLLGSDAGDLSFLNIPVFVDAGGSVGDRLLVRNSGQTAPSVVTVTANSVGAASGDTLFGKFPGAGLTYAGLGLGTLEVDLGDTAFGGNTVNLQSTSAARTRLVGSAGQDTFVLGSFAGLSPTEAFFAAQSGARNQLAFINGVVEIDGVSGGDGVVLGDSGATSGNANVAVTGDLVTGFAGSNDAAVVRVNNVANLILIGSDLLGETFTLNNPVAAVTVQSGGGSDTVNVNANALGVTLDLGAGDDAVNVGNGSLAGVNGPLFVNAGAGNNRLTVSDANSGIGRIYAVTSNAIFGATPNPISFVAPGGRFFAPGGGGVTLLGGNGNDTFNVFDTTAASQFRVNGGGGDDVFSVNSLTTLGTIALEGGAGADTLAFDPGNAVNKAVGVTFDGGGGGDGFRFLGRTDDEDETVTITLTGANSGTFTGRGAPFPFSNVAFADFDGRAGRNALNVLDASGISRNVVFTPASLTGGRFDFDGSFRIGVTNVNNGLTYAGTFGGSGGLDDLTYQGFSDLNAGPNPTFQGGDDLFATDSLITNFNDGLGEIIPLAIGRDNGAPTLSALRILGGNETGSGGDRIGVRPSDDIPITVDGQGPNRAPGDRLSVLTGGAAGVTAVNFENRPAVRSIFAVGADAGGGPRVRVFDAGTNTLLFDQFVYDPAFLGGVRVATGDVTGDGVADLVTAAGFGGGPHIKVFDGVTFQEIGSFFAYESAFRGGAFVAVGDLTGSGVSQIITGAGNGGGPLVKVFDAAGNPQRSFFAYADIFRGGVRVAAGDVNGDGLSDIVTGAGVGGGPHVRVFSGLDNSVLTEYLAYDANYRGGVYVAAGDVDGDGFADIVTGPGDNSVPFLTFRSSLDGGAIVQVNPFSAIDNAPAAPVPASVSAFNVELGGIRVAVVPNTDGSAGRVVAARGPGFAPRLVNYLTGPGLGSPTDGGLAFEPEFIGGLYVG